MEITCSISDSIEFASQMGRLDFISASLAVVTILIPLAGLFTFLNIKSAAKKEAKEIAGEKAEEIANKYSQDNLPTMIDQYDKFAQNINASNANKIAQAQESNQNDS